MPRSSERLLVVSHRAPVEVDTTASGAYSGSFSVTATYN